MFKSLTNIILRTPLNSINKIHAADKSLNNPLFKEGLYVAAPEFWSELKKVNSKNDKGKEKINLSLFKYHTRSCMRCTPFGAFASCAVVKVGERTNLLLDESRYLLKSRLDMSLLFDIVDRLNKVKIVKDAIRYTQNNTIYSVGNNLRYTTYENKNGKRIYNLESVTQSEYLLEILKFANQPVTLSQLIHHIIVLTSASYNDAEQFIEELVSSQLLISELEPDIVGEDPFSHLIDVLNRCGLNEIVTTLKSINAHLKESDKIDGFNEKLIHLIHQLPIETEITKCLVQADLFYESDDLEISSETVNTIVKQVEELSVVSSKSVVADLENFKKKFTLKYETQHIPLLVALDSDLGIGYGPSADEKVNDEFINNLPIQAVSSTSNFNSFHNLALLKYIQTQDSHSKFIEITEADIKNTLLEKGKETYPSSLYIMGSLLNCTDKPNFILYGIGGPSGANLLGRFAHGSESIRKLSKDIIKGEEDFANEHEIFAEVAHLPELRTGNILSRPLLRKHVIPYLSNFNTSSTVKIPLQDIIVKVESDEIILFSKKYQKRIIPRLTSAQNFKTNSLPLYKFLCDLQKQGLIQPIFWDWGPLDSLKHLPRVVYKSLIVKKERWIVSEQDIADIPNVIFMYVDYFRQFRVTYNMPQQVVYSEGDNDLLIDFEVINCLKILVKYIKKYKEIKLEEFLHDSHNSLVRNKANEPYVNELIIPVINLVEPTSYKPVLQLDNKIKRKYVPGSEWLYFKIYCGVDSSNKILTKMLFDFVADSSSSKNFEKFFFIRFNDTFPHLRIRFYNQNIPRLFTLQQQFISYLEEHPDYVLIDKIVIDTYNREVERYSLNFMELAETIFMHDSIATLKLLKCMSDNNEIKLLTAILSIDSLLNDFNLDLYEKGEFMHNLSESYFHEWGGSITLKKSLDSTYKKLRNRIVIYLSKDNIEFSELQSIRSSIEERSFSVRNIIRDAFSQNVLSNDSVVNILSSIIHMSMNRFFPTIQRKYELLVYGVVSRYYSSLIKRSTVN